MLLVRSDPNTNMPIAAARGELDFSDPPIPIR